MLSSTLEKVASHRTLLRLLHRRDSSRSFSEAHLSLGSCRIVSFTLMDDGFGDGLDDDRMDTMMVVG